MTPILSLDFGDRKEVWQLLQRISEEKRMEWLHWCCEQSRGFGKHPVKAVGPGVLGEVFECWKQLCHAFKLDMAKSRAKLEEIVKQHGIPLQFSGGLLLG